MLHLADVLVEARDHRCGAGVVAYGLRGRACRETDGERPNQYRHAPPDLYARHRRDDVATSMPAGRTRTHLDVAARVRRCRRSPTFRNVADRRLPRLSPIADMLNTPGDPQCGRRRGHHPGSTPE